MFLFCSNIFLESFKLETESNGIYPDPELERDIYEGARVNPLLLGNVNSDQQQDVFELLKTFQQSNGQAPTPATKPPVETAFSRFITSKIPIVIIAFAVYLLFTFNFEGFLAGSVFSLFIIWEIFEFIMTAFVMNTNTQQNQWILIFAMSVGLSQRSVQILLKCLGLANKILRDVAIFLFTFVLIHLTYNYYLMGESLNKILDKDFNNMFSKEEL